MDRGHLCITCGCREVNIILEILLHIDVNCDQYMNILWSRGQYSRYIISIIRIIFFFKVNLKYTQESRGVPVHIGTIEQRLILYKIRQYRGKYSSIIQDQYLWESMGELVYIGSMEQRLIFYKVRSCGGLKAQYLQNSIGQPIHIGSLEQVNVIQNKALHGSISL